MRTTILLISAAVALLAAPVLADEAATQGTLAKMPIREVTVFKDGHALVLHSGKLATDAAGNIVMDYLPTPVLGTFWPYVADKGVKLAAVVASQQRVSVERTALSIQELLEANAGADVIITESVGNQQPDKVYPATIVGVPTRTSKELAETSPPNTPEQLPVKAGMILLKVGEGTKAVNIGQIKDVTFKAAAVKAKSANEEFRNALTLKLAGDKKPANVEAGMMYIQRGVRWIPQYKVNLDGKGGATVTLQATLINELADLDDVTVHLVIGVPTIKFAGEIDPIALGQQLANLSQYMQPNARTRYGFSNAMQAQAAAQVESNEPAPPVPGPELGPVVGGGAGHEDLFVFDVQHVTLKRGQRMVLPINETALTYQDVYTLDVPFAPPPEVWPNVLSYLRGQGSVGSETEAARLLNQPKVMHKIRLANSGKCPLTTAPALVLANGTVLAQGMMLYTPIGGSTDLTVGTAVDIQVKKSEAEKSREPQAIKWEGDVYAKVMLEGSLKLTDRKDKAVEVEVTRYVLGNVGEADHDGKASMINVLEDSGFLPADDNPFFGWWQSYGWPGWWSHFNGVGKIVWKIKLDPGKSEEMKYSWNYYWR